MSGEEAGRRSEVVDLFARAGISLSDEEANLLSRYATLIVERAQSHDLTSVRDFAEVVVKHLIDSVFPFRNRPIAGPLLDVGSGPGLPGIPLKIMQPSLRVLLAEDREKKIRFLHEALSTLHLSNTEILPHRIHVENFPNEVRAVATRALEPVGKTLNRCRNALSSGSLIYFLKGPSVDAEILEAEKQEKRSKSAFRLVTDEAYRLPILEHGRRLLIYERL